MWIRYRFTGLENPKIPGIQPMNKSRNLKRGTKVSTHFYADNLEQSTLLDFLILRECKLTQQLFVTPFFEFFVFDLLVSTLSSTKTINELLLRYRYIMH